MRILYIYREHLKCLKSAQDACKSAGQTVSHWEYEKGKYEREEDTPRKKRMEGSFWLHMSNHIHFTCEMIMLRWSALSGN
uniref:Uncharacterized protein n=1 Tax=Hippocampus comes TaxID=109280 RepID=A0A3Q2Y0J1_HIPCM